MYKTICLTAALLFGVLASTAQRWNMSLNPDSLSWQLYQQGRWEELLHTGKQLNKQGIDYYYLRMRMAVAAIETGRYDDACLFLDKALIFNPRDIHARRLLVLARQYSLMPAEAGSVFANMPLEQQSKLNFKPGFTLLSSHVDLGNTWTSLKRFVDFNALAGEAGIYGAQSGLYRSGFVDAGLWMQLRSGWLMYGGVQSMQHNFLKQYAFLDKKMQLDRVEVNGNFKDFYYNIDATPTIFEASSLTSQKTIYLQMRHAPSHRFSLVASASLSKLKGTFSYAYTDTLIFTDTARLNLNSGLATLFTLEVPHARIDYNLWQTTDWRLALGALVHLGRVSLSSGLHLGSVNDTSLMQFQAGYVWRPAGNARIWQQTEAFLLRSNHRWRSAIKIAAGQWFGQKTRLTASLISGQINGLADQWGYVIFNHRDRIDLSGEFALTQQIVRPLNVNISYRYGRSVLKAENLNQNNQLVFSTKQLISHGIIGGLIWNF